MPAVKKSLVLDRGATWTLSIRYKDSNGTPVDLTGWSATIDLYNKGVLALTFTAVVTADGYINFKVADESTATFADFYEYNIDLINPTGDVTRLFFGPMTVRGLA